MRVPSWPNGGRGRAGGACKIGRVAAGFIPRRLAAALVLFLIVPAPPALRAHHAFAAEYDVNQPLTVSGTVQKFTWENPHAWLIVDVSSDGGKAVRWSFEMGSPSGLTHRGWTRTAVKPGDSITVDAFRAKDGSNKANARTVTLPGGRKLFGGFQSTPGAPAK